MIDIKWRNDIINALIKKDSNVTIEDYFEVLKDIEKVYISTQAIERFKSKNRLQPYIRSLTINQTK